MLDPVRRAKEAQALLDHPLLVEARDGVRQQILDAWEASQDRDQREQLWLALTAHTKLFGYLAAMVTNGKIEELAEVARQAQTPP